VAECAHILAEPAGVAALAGAWREREALRGERVVLVLTGANLTMALLKRALATPPLFPVPARAVDVERWAGGDDHKPGE